MEEVKSIAKSQLKTLANEAKNIKSSLETAKRHVKKATDTVEKYKASMTDVSVVANEQSLLQTLVDQTKKVESDLAILKAGAKSLVEQAKELKSKENPHTKMVKLYTKELSEFEAALEKRKTELVEFEDKVEIAKNVVDVFSPAGVRAHILDTVTPFLNDRTAHYLGALSDGNINATWNTLSTTTKGELREKFTIDVSNEKGAKKFKGLSGGEKRKVRLATAMALQDMVASRATKPINLFVADEVDHALDKAGLERLMGILDEKARDRGTVLVISHNELSDWIRDQAVVTKEFGYATISGALS